MTNPIIRRRFKALAATVAVATPGSMIAFAAPHAAAADVSGTPATYVVLYHSGASTADAGSMVAAAGGVLVANYSAIGVVVARSSDADFATTVKQNSKVEGAGATTGLGTGIGDDAVTGSAASPQPAAAAWGTACPACSGTWPRSTCPRAHAVTLGSKTVRVADLDTASTSPIRISRPITTRPTAPTAPVALRLRCSTATTGTVTARTPPGRSRLRQTARAS